jgi:hypothetical protein
MGCHKEKLRMAAETFRNLVADREFIDVFVDAPIEECIRETPRDSMPRPRPVRFRT